MSCTIQVTEDWYQNSYRSSGFSVQRRYPNEELLWVPRENESRARPHSQSPTASDWSLIQSLRGLL